MSFMSQDLNLIEHLWKIWSEVLYYALYLHHIFWKKDVHLSSTVVEPMPRCIETILVVAQHLNKIYYIQGHHICSIKGTQKKLSKTVLQV